MFYHDDELQFEVRVDKPDPIFAKALQQLIGGVEGEMRVCLQYLFQAWSVPADLERFRHLLLETATEEIGHIEMLATAVAKNLEGAPLSVRNEAMRDPTMRAALAGEMPRHVLSSGLHALPVDSNGVPFNGSWVVASGNLAADMYANVMAEATGRLVGTRLWEMTDDPGMKDMLGYLIARDGMHQNQWLAALEELGDHLPVPASFPLGDANADYNYAFITTRRDGREPPRGRWNQGPSIDGKGEFAIKPQPGGGPANLRATDPKTHDDVKRFVQQVEKVASRTTR